MAQYRLSHQVLNFRGFNGGPLNMCVCSHARAPDTRSVRARVHTHTLARTNIPNCDHASVRSLISWGHHWFSGYSVFVLLFVCPVRYGAVVTNHLLTALCVHLTFSLIGCSVFTPFVRIADSPTSLCVYMTWSGCSTGPINDNYLLHCYGRIFVDLLLFWPLPVGP